MASRFSWGEDMAIGGRNHQRLPSRSFSAGWSVPPSPANSLSSFSMRWREDNENDNDEELKWAAIERLPTYDRLRKGVLKIMHDNGKIVHCPIDVTHLGMQDKKILLDSILNIVEEDNEKFLRVLRSRIDRYVFLCLLIESHV